LDDFELKLKETHEKAMDDQSANYKANKARGQHGKTEKADEDENMSGEEKPQVSKRKVQPKKLAPKKKSGVGSQWTKKVVAAPDQKKGKTQRSRKAKREETSSEEEDEVEDIDTEDESEEDSDILLTSESEAEETE